MSLHQPILKKLIDAKCLNNIISACCENGTRNDQYDICVGFFHMSSTSLTRKNVITPDFIISSCTWITERAEERALLKTARFIIGICEDKFNLEIGCNPAQVSSMHAEMGDRESTGIPHQLAALSFKTMPAALTELDPETLLKSRRIDFMSDFETISESEVWAPMVEYEAKRVDRVAAEVNKTEPVKYRVNIQRYELTF